MNAAPSLPSRPPAGARVMLAATLAALSLLPLPPRAAAQDEAAAPENGEAEPAEVEVEGLGWWKNRRARQVLRLIEPQDQTLTTIDAIYLEDAALVLQAELEREGFLRSSGAAELRREGEVVGTFPWDWANLPQPPRQARGDGVTFRLEPGVRFTFESLEVEGLEGREREEAEAFFVARGFLLEGAAARLFTPARLRGGVSNLRESLRRRGYADAAVRVVEQRMDEETGQVHVVIAVERGPLHRVAGVEMAPHVPEDVRREIEEVCAGAAGAEFSNWWQQDLQQSVRNVLFRQGYAAAIVRVTPRGEEAAGDEVRLRFALEVRAGPKVHVGEITFEGAGETSESVLLRALETETGDLLDRVRIEQDRLNLSSLGIFRGVRVKTTEVQPDIWDLRYRLQPGKRFEVAAHAGYGSYERFRGGIELARSNLFGRAHRVRLDAIASMKATYVDTSYVIPQVFGTRTDASLRGYSVSREEVSFEREELGVSVGLQSPTPLLGAEASLRYQFESLAADPRPGARGILASETRVGALTFDLVRNRRDSVINPRAGYLVSLTAEIAARELGSQVDFQRLELHASWHRRLGRETIGHVGLRHGVLWSQTSPGEQVPLNRRFFPGGESTIRGYHEGEASPRTVEGTIIGARVSTILNLELEQALTRQLSAVAFVDAGLTGAQLDNYPGDDARISVGLGLRYHSIIGPVRLEYGHNVVREEGDRRGAVHFSLGFPF